MGKDNKTQIFDGGSDWDDVDGEEDDRDEKVGPIPRTRAPTRASASASVSASTAEDTARCAEGVRQWQAFARGGGVLDDYRRAGLDASGKRPQKDAIPVEQNVVAPVQGTLIDFDDDADDADDGQVEVLGAGEDALAERGIFARDSDGQVEAMSEVQDTPPTLDNDLINFEEDDDGYQAEGVSQPIMRLPSMRLPSMLVEVSLTSRVEEVAASPFGGDLIELS